MTPDQEQRRLAETWPDGTFGGPRPDPAAPPAPAVRRPPRPVTGAEAARHRRELLAALDETPVPSTAAPRRHLQAVPTPQEDAMQITAVETQVLAGIARGESSARIAERLHLTPGAVKAHTERMRVTNHVHTSEQLVHLGYTHGLLTSLAPEPRHPVTLPPRQQEVLQHIAAGRTNDDIATLLGISIATVVEHARRLRDTLDAHNRPHLVALAHQHGHLTTHPTTAVA